MQGNGSIATSPRLWGKHSWVGRCPEGHSELRTSYGRSDGLRLVNSRFDGRHFGASRSTTSWSDPKEGPLPHIEARSSPARPGTVYSWRVHPAVAIRYPFLTLEQAGHFLGIRYAEARRLYDRGDLPKAFRLDGGIFEPTPWVVLVPYLEFKEQVGIAIQRELEGWQRGEIEIAPAGDAGHRSRTRTLSVVASEEGLDA